MFISNKYYETYATASVFGAAVFLLMQILLLLEFAYAWNERWCAKGEEEDKWYKYILFCAAILFIAGIVLIVLEWRFFTNDDGCDLSQIFIIATVVIGILFTSLQMYLRTGSLLSSAVVWFYCAQITWSSLMSQPNTADKQCNSLQDSTTGSTWQLILGLGFTVVAVAYKAQKAATQQGVITGASPRRDAVDFGAPEADATKDESEQPEADDQDYGFTYFHLVFALGCMYIAMLMTQWGTSGATGSEVSDNLSIDRGTTSMWVNIGSVWVTAILYIWTLLAPKLLSDREF
jgi:hypothetical protein